MTIEEAYDYFFFKARQNQIGNVSPKTFNLLAKQAQLKAIDKLLGDIDRYAETKPNPTIYLGATNTIYDKISPLITTSICNVTSGNVNPMPIDFYYFILMEANSLIDVKTCGTTTTNTFSWVDVEIKQYNTKNYYINSKIVAPSVVHPIGFKLGNTFSILPSTISQVRITYIRKPADPKFGYSSVGDNIVYSSTASRDWEIHESMHEEMIEMMLNQLSTSLRDMELDNLTKNTLSQS